MAITAPARRSDLQTAPQPGRTEPPERKRPRDRPRPGGQGRSSATASVATPAPPKRKAGTTKRKAAPGRKKASGGGKKPTATAPSPIRKVSDRVAAAAPARKAPPRRKAAPRHRPAGVIPIAAGTAVRGAVAITQLPESGLIHRLTRGRAWIGVLGVLLVGIVALNVVTLSFAASAGKIDQRNQELGKENSMLQSRAAGALGQRKITNEAKKQGLGATTAANPKMLTAGGGDVATAAARLSAAAAGTVADSEDSTEGEEATGEPTGAVEEGQTGEEVGAESGESEFTPEELEIYEREYAELLAAEGGG